jgi:hypothetical protein
MAAYADQTSYPALLGGEACAGEKGKMAEPLLTQDKDPSIGGPVWAGIYLCLTHVVGAVFVSSFSRVPYVGESPAWLHAAIFIVNIVGGLLDHLGAYVVQPGKIQGVMDRVLLPLALPGLVFFIAKLYTVGPLWTAHALVFALLVIIVGPSVAYKKITTKDAPNVYNDRLESYNTRSGLALHLAIDTCGALWFVVCWVAMGCPPLMTWLR